MMRVSFHIPGPLRSFTESRSIVQLEVAANTNLLDALQRLFVAFPGLRDRVLNESGEVRRHVNLFVGNENVRYTGGLMTPVGESAEISIVPAISGG